MKKDEPQLSEEELVAAKQRAQERDLDGWVNWLARPEKKIAIVGFTPSRNEAPWDDPSFEKWTCNNLHMHLKPEQKWDRLYDLHSLEQVRSDKQHEAFLRQTDKPVVVWKPQPEWPTAKPFPREQVLQSFGRYFNNSISWMVAAALLEGVTELHIYGVDMAQGGDNSGNGEYARQRPSCEWMIGVAQGRGVKIHIPATSDLLKIGALYGVEDDSPLWNKMTSRERELGERLNILQQQNAQITAQINQLSGALEDVRYWRTVWTNPRGDREQKPAEVPAQGA